MDVYKNEYIHRFSAPVVPGTVHISVINVQIYPIFFVCSVLAVEVQRCRLLETGLRWHSNTSKHPLLCNTHTGKKLLTCPFGPLILICTM
jgi:hypothetical protein